MNRLVGRAVALELVRAGVHEAPLLDAFYSPTDRIMQRWAVGMGDGLPDADVDPQSRPPPLDDVTQGLIDRIVQKSPTTIGYFVRQWYCSPVPVTTMAALRGMDSRKLYDVWKEVLLYLKAHFELTRHPDLINLLTGRL